MTIRTTHKDIERQARRFAGAIERLTGERPKFDLQHGNAKQGIAWKFYIAGLPGGHGHIGRTAREAMLCLAARAEGIEMMEALQR